MIDDLIKSTRERLDKLFPERQIIHRSGGQINSFVIGQRAQVISVSVASIIALWCVFTVINLAWGHNPLRSPAKEVRRVEQQYKRMLVDAQAKEANALALLEAQQRDFDKARDDFEERHGVLREIIGGSNLLASAAPITSASYASSQIMMAPVQRDPIGRMSRSDIVVSQDARATSLQSASFASLTTDQDHILVQTEERAQDNIESTRAILRESGVNVEALLQAGPFGRGGPEIRLDDAEGAEAGNFGSRITAIRARVMQAEALERAMSSMPFGHPVDDEHYLTSTYGSRLDPFTKRMSWHDGIDIAGRNMAPIVATAPGQVSFVGKRAGYGNVIEIDHDHGIKTRYAHLAKIYVKRGQIIAKGEKIGGMGSTGRSTSTHLHYEVMFEGRAKDPDKFMRAGRYVQQN